MCDLKGDERKGEIESFSRSDLVRDFPKHGFFGQKNWCSMFNLCTFVYLFREIWCKDPEYTPEI